MATAAGWGAAPEARLRGLSARRRSFHRSLTPLSAAPPLLACRAQAPLRLVCKRFREAVDACPELSQTLSLYTWPGESTDALDPAALVSFAASRAAAVQTAHIGSAHLPGRLEAVQQLWGLTELRLGTHDDDCEVPSGGDLGSWLAERGLGLAPLAPRLASLTLDVDSNGLQPGTCAELAALTGLTFLKLSTFADEVGWSAAAHDVSCADSALVRFHSVASQVLRASPHPPLLQVPAELPAALACMPQLAQLSLAVCAADEASVLIGGGAWEPMRASTRLTRLTLESNYLPALYGDYKGAMGFACQSAAGIERADCNTWPLCLPPACLLRVHIPPSTRTLAHLARIAAAVPPALPAGEMDLGQLLEFLPALRCLKTEGHVRSWGDLWTAGTSLTRLAINDVWDIHQLPPVPAGGALPALRELLFGSGSDWLPALPQNIFAAVPGVTSLELRAYGAGGLWGSADHDHEALYASRVTQASGWPHRVLPPRRCVALRGLLASGWLPAVTPGVAACTQGLLIAWLTCCRALAPLLPTAHRPGAPDTALQQDADPARHLSRHAQPAVRPSCWLSPPACMPG